MIGLNWGATSAERAEEMPCDTLVEGTATRADRAISIDAPPAIVFAWLCQLRVAPYSYDLIDNFGRRSPRCRDRALEKLEPGQRFMTLFTLHSFVDCTHITLRTQRVAVTYAVQPQGAGTRLHVRVLFDGPRLMGRLAAFGDLVMMRKQLLTLKSLAEGEFAPRARRSEVGADQVIGGGYDYADAFEIDIGESDARSPEQMFRAAVDNASWVQRWVPLAHRRLLRFRLAAPAAPDQILGWRIVDSDCDVVRLNAEGPLIRGAIVGRRTENSVAVFTTYVYFVRRWPARAVWAIAGRLHRRIAPYLLRRGVATSDWISRPGGR